jgi:hypothetical protein
VSCHSQASAASELPASSAPQKSSAEEDQTWLRDYAVLEVGIEGVLSKYHTPIKIDVYICRIYNQYLVIVYIIQLEYGYRSRFGVGRIDTSWTDIAQAEEPRIIMWESEKEPASESQLHGFLLSRLSLSSVGPLSSKIIRAQVAMQMQKQQEEQAMSEAFAAFAQCETRTKTQSRLVSP